jgi:cell division protein ZapA
MPELFLEIGGRSFSIVCESGEEPSLERAARHLDREAQRVVEQTGRPTERQLLLLSGLMLADTMSAAEDRLRATEQRLAATEERLRQAEAKAAMLAANALKLETEANHRPPDPEVIRLREEKDKATALLERTAREIDEIAASVEASTPR